MALLNDPLGVFSIETLVVEPVSIGGLAIGDLVVTEPLQNLLQLSRHLPTHKQNSSVAHFDAVRVVLSTQDDKMHGKSASKCRG
jgi:hypothetical protein